MAQDNLVKRHDVAKDPFKMKRNKLKLLMKGAIRKKMMSKAKLKRKITKNIQRNWRLGRKIKVKK